MVFIGKLRYKSEVQSIVNNTELYFIQFLTLMDMCTIVLRPMEEVCGERIESHSNGIEVDNNRNYGFIDAQRIVFGEQQE